jgi:hypothetical protein
MSNFVQSRQNNAVADGHTHTRPPEYAFILSTLSEERVRTFALDNIGCQWNFTIAKRNNLLSSGDFVPDSPGSFLNCNLKDLDENILLK